MKVLDKILRRHSHEDEPEAAVTDASKCAHAVIVPRWDRVDDIGNEDNVSGYRCETCSADFTPEEGRELQESLADRVHLG